ncbi:MAG: InlB B-repeat-containing protein, partial [Ilumatobacteraceae bacterium]
MSCASATLYAQWTPDTLTVDYHPNGGSGAPAAQTVTCASGSVTLSSTAPTLTDYTFAGWNTELGGGGTAYAAGASVSCEGLNSANLTLYAQWLGTIVYDANGGSGDPADETCTPGSTPTLSSTIPTRPGHTFTGWNTEAGGGGTGYASGASVSCVGLTLYAQWSADPVYTVTFNANGGTGAPAALECWAGSVTLPSTVPTRPGYTFAGWSVAVNGSDTVSMAVTGITMEGPSQYQSGTIVSYGSWISLNEQLSAGQRLVFDKDFFADLLEEFPNMDSIKIGIKDPATWSNTAIYYSGAFVNDQFVNIVRYPTGNRIARHYTQNSYTGLEDVILNAQDYEVFFELTSDGNNIRYGQRRGGAGTNATRDHDIRITQYSDWNTNNKAETGDQGYGFTAVDAVMLIDVGSNGQLDTANIDWTGIELAASPGASVSCDDLTLYAQWSQNPVHTVTYQPMGGTGEPADQTCTSGLTVTLSTTVPTRTGYTFLGWTSDADSHSTVHAAGSTLPCADMTLNAQWAPGSSFTVTYEPNGGTGDPADQTCTSTTVTLSSTVPTRAGYTFAGWNTQADSNGTVHAAGSTVSCADVTLYAQWTQLEPGTTWACTVDTSDGYTAGVAYVSTESNGTLSLYRAARGTSTGPWELSLVQTYAFESTSTANAMMMDSNGTLYVHLFPRDTGGATKRLRLNTDGTTTEIATFTGADVINMGAFDGTRFVGGSDGDGSAWFSTNSPTSDGYNPGFFGTPSVVVKDLTVVPSGNGGTVSTSYAGWVAGLSIDQTMLLINPADGQFVTLAAGSLGGPAITTTQNFGAAFTMGDKMFFVNNDGQMVSYGPSGLAQENVTNDGYLPMTVSSDVDAASCFGVTDLVLTPDELTYDNSNGSSSAPDPQDCVGGSWTITSTTPTKNGND